MTLAAMDVHAVQLGGSGLVSFQSEVHVLTRLDLAYVGRSLTSSCWTSQLTTWTLMLWNGWRDTLKPRRLVLPVPNAE